MGRFVPNAAAGKEKTANALQDLQTGIESLVNADNFRQYLSTMGKFRQYSANNTLLIMMQGIFRGIDTDRVAGYKAWQALGYQVRKGEKGLAILAPMTKRDPKTGDEEFIGWRTTSVFGVSQVDPIPGKAKNLDTVGVAGLVNGDADDCRELLSALEVVAVSHGCTVAYKPLADAHGYYAHATREIVIRHNNPPAHQAKTLTHEIAHHLTPNILDMSRADREAIAESAAFVVCNVLGLDTSGYSFGYVANWVRGEIGIVKRNLAIIKKIADTILDGLAPEPAEGPGDETADDTAIAA
jgi:antirestriction protein ArdC